MNATNLDYTVLVDATSLDVKADENWPLDDLTPGETVHLNLQIVVSDRKVSASNHSEVVADFVNKHSSLLLKICQQNLSTAGCIITSVNASAGSVRINIGIVIGAAFAIAVNYQALRENIPIIAHDAGQFVSMALELIPEANADEPSPEVGTPNPSRDKEQKSPRADQQEPGT